MIAKYSRDAIKSYQQKRNYGFRSYGPRDRIFINFELSKDDQAYSIDFNYHEGQAFVITRVQFNASERSMLYVERLNCIEQHKFEEVVTFEPEGPKVFSTCFDICIEDWAHLRVAGDDDCVVKISGYFCDRGEVRGRPPIQETEYFSQFNVLCQ